MENKLKAALYIRVSTEEQAMDGQSVSAQEEALRQYCSAYGIDVFKVYTDLGISGKSLKDRCELQRLIDACCSHQFDMVLVWKISRLSRNLGDLLYLIDIFEKHNVFFASCSEKFDTSTPVGRMTLQLLGSIAEFERNTIVENVRLGLAEFARTGGKSSSVLGYDNIDKRLAVNENEAAIVRLIFSLYTEGAMSFSAIADYLNGMGFTTKRGSKFRSSSVSYIIHNPVYIGSNRHCINTEKEYLVKAAHEALIDKELWNKAQAAVSQRKKREIKGCDAVDGSFFHVTCKLCNSQMKVFYACSKGKRYKYLRCCSCSNYLNVESLIKVFSEKIITILMDETLQADAFKLLTQSSKVYSIDSMQISAAEDEIKRLQRSKARYLSLFECYKLSDTKAFIARIEEIEKQLKLLENKKLNVVRSEAARVNAGSPAVFFEKLIEGVNSKDSSVLKRLYACLVREIRANKGDIDIVLYL